MQKTQVKTAQLGRTGLEITRIGFGAWALGGGGWEFGWGPQDDQESLAAIHHALEQGINWIDTAAAYGFGRSERVIGRALEGMQERPYVFTKCSLLEGPGRRVVHSLKRDSILREADASLERLGIDAIDLYQIHWPIPEEDIEEGWSTLVELKQQGLVRHIGVSNFNVEQMRRIERIAPVETLQPPYSLIDREVEAEILPFCEREDIGVIVYSPMGSGLLTGKMTRERIENLPDDDWAQTRSALPRAAAVSPPCARGPAESRRRAIPHDSRRGRGRLDASTPGRRRCDRRLPPPRSGGSDPRGREPRAHRRGRRKNRRQAVIARISHYFAARRWGSV
jgi:aryl-alcohol dehydrogenase-like predicted oxidoreductase